MNSALLEPKKIIRTRRRTIALVVSDSGEFTVRAPLHAADAQIRRFIEQKSDWILARRAEAAARPLPAKLTGADGETLPLLGRTLSLRGADVKKARVAGDELLLPRGGDTLAVLEKWLRETARRLFEERCALWGARLGVRASALRLSSARTRWGSCSAVGSVNLNWRLLFFPLEYVDYVVAHELCHIKHHDHSAAFWRELAAVMPEYRQRREYLKKHRRDAEIM